MRSKQEAKIKVDFLVRELWIALRDMSDYAVSDAVDMSNEDLELFGAVTRHSAVQNAIDKAMQKG